MTPPDDSQEHDDNQRRGRNVLTASPLVWVLLVAAAGWAVWSTATKGSGKPTPVRALVIPTGQATARTIAVLPCSATGSSSSTSAKQLRGLDTVVLPRDSGERVVLVPSCGANSGASSASGGGSKGGAAAIVLPPGTAPPSPRQTIPLGGSGSGSSGAKAKISVVYRLPQSSRAHIVVVVPCTGKKRGDSGGASPQPAAPESGGGLALAPPCGATGGS
jgi:hypothetical protein